MAARAHVRVFMYVCVYVCVCVCVWKNEYFWRTVGFLCKLLAYKNTNKETNKQANKNNYAMNNILGVSLWPNPSRGL